MKTKLFAVLLGLAAFVVGCVSTVTGGKTTGVPFVDDTIEAQYPRPMDQVYQAAVEVIQYNGAIINENVLHGQTNAVNGIVKAIEGKVNQRSVWIRVQQADPKVTTLMVQTRTQGGGTDKDLAAMIDKQIALKLVR